MLKLKKGEIMIETRVIVRVDEKAEHCDTVEEAIEKGLIRCVKSEAGTTALQRGIAGRVDIDKAQQLALDSLFKWEG